MSDVARDYRNDLNYLTCLTAAAQLASDRSNAVLGENRYVQADDRNWNTEFKKALGDVGLRLGHTDRRDAGAPMLSPIPIPDRGDGWPAKTWILWEGDHS